MTSLVSRVWWLPTDLSPWVGLLGPILVGGLILVGLAAVVAALARRGRSRLTVWRVAIVGLILLPVAELAGLPAQLTGPLRQAAPDYVPEPIVGRTQYGRAVVHPAEPPAGPASWPAYVWLAGVGVVLGRRALGGLALLRLRHRLQTLAPGDLVVRVAAVGRRCGYRRLVRVRVANGLASPLVFGHRRPVLVVPPDFAETFTPAQQEAVIAHELGHLAHRDPVWQWLATVAVALNWWNPVVWWARARHRDAGEAAADEFTAGVREGPTLLAESLVLLGRRLVARQLAGSFPIAGGPKSGLAVRVRRLLALDPAARRPRSSPVGPLALALGMPLAILVGTAWARPPEPVEPVRWATAAAGGPEQAVRLQVEQVEVFVCPFGGVGGDVPDDGRSDQEAIAGVGLTGDQMLRYLRLQTDIDAEALELDANNAAWERWVLLNRKAATGLQKILTPEQYQKYVDYWTAPTRPVVPALRMPVYPVPGEPGVRGAVGGG
jgi:beta-lactamase regulating signal transducer with metallopeptidase domain